VRASLLLVVVTSLAVPALAKPHGGPKPRGECTVEITSPQSAPTGRSGTPLFRATQILDVQIHVALPRRLTGEHQVDIDVLNPNGHTYQRLTVPFVGADRKPKKRKLEGYPHPVGEQEQKERGRHGRAAYAVSATLPVAGTSIVTSSLYGDWNAEVFLDGAVEPCGVRAPFRIME
jgi:hypothetical protein